MLHLRGENGQKQGLEALWQQNHVLKLLNYYAGGKAELSFPYMEVDKKQVEDLQKKQRQ